MTKRQLFLDHVKQLCDAMAAECEKHGIGLLAAFDVSDLPRDEREHDSIISRYDPNGFGEVAGTITLCQAIISEQAPEGLTIDLTVTDNEDGSVMEYHFTDGPSQFPPQPIDGLH